MIPGLQVFMILLLPILQMFTIVFQSFLTFGAKIFEARLECVYMLSRVFTLILSSVQYYQISKFAYKSLTNINTRCIGYQSYSYDEAMPSPDG